jgi:RNA polymerase sigma factor (sigma-70 family)
MASGFLRQLHRTALRRDGGGLTDGQLLASFIERRDEAAFAALVRRHGPMVLGVCRRVLGNHHDAEDAFQATFLVLARKAGSLRSRELVGNWLYGTAYRTALEARATITRRRAKERQVEEMPQPRVEPDAVWRELRPFLDQELNRLPEKYRLAVVLCDLEGRTRKEVARQLKVPEGTVSSRLATARQLLARRLARYGLAVSGGAVASALGSGAASACVPLSLLRTTARAGVVLTAGEAVAAGDVPARVVALSEGVMKTMLLTKLKAVVAVAVLVFVSAGMVGLTYRPASADAPKAERPLADDLEALRMEVEALRKSLQATRERVKMLETEVKAVRGKEAASPKEQKVGERLQNKWLEDMVAAEEGVTSNYYKRLNAFRKMLETEDPLADAEAALKKLRQDPKDKQAADALERSLQRLKERAKPDVKKE